MTAAEQNLIQYMEDNYSGWEPSEAIEDALTNDKDLFLSHVLEVVKEGFNVQSEPS